MEDKTISAMQMAVARQRELENLTITEQCKTEIEVILDKYSCRIEVSMIIKPDGNIPQIAIARNR